MPREKEDFTKIIEEIVAEESSLFKDTLQEELAKVRTVGSAEVSMEEQKVEWELMEEQPEVMAKFFSDQNASVASAIRYADMMSKQGKEK